ncbi:IMP-specific 5'-nucleotidase 1 [Selaginella moellendorffii]|uniref:IMP-specific 5'-nucleotidase 1 n=2 Tax=Selaginella moellendorffii TaxID=88036 RepID=UPI000D1CFA0A|nr:IMP-specific 5'-nucleotidase 1 [Selaginella moellendorffii]|eukprot:XP_024536496.1 IMP-specific 5'-nucleotidase 1 [Selaginella moellendorffii]
MRWSMLLSREVLEDAHVSRASSVTDAHVLRRKGRLKEQDGLIEFIISLHSTHSPIQVMEKMERWIKEHSEDPMRSTLSRLIPSVGRFYTPLPLVRAFHEYDEFASLSRRRYVPPNFAEIRHVINIAQVHAIAEKLALVTFDADGTIYSDGHHIERDNKMIAHIIKLMQRGIHVAILTAAGYPGDPTKFEDRFSGLLSAFEELELASRVTRYFQVMGGECNYLLRVNNKYRLEFVPDDMWKSKDMLEWSEEGIEELLDEAQGALQSASARLNLPVHFVRKPRAVGVIPKVSTIYEVLEEMALTVQVHLVESKLPFCAFNGGSDVFVDVGNKSIGLGALMKYLGKKPYETLHVGDRFTVSGNDSAARSKCAVLWVANPEETGFFARLLHNDIRLAQLTLYIE